MKRFKTQTVTAGDAQDKFGTRFFCENPILSISTPGNKYQAIKVEHDGSIPMLTLKELQSIIDTCAAFMDIQNAQGQGPAFRKALQRITSRLESTHLQEIVQEALRSKY